MSKIKIMIKKNWTGDSNLPHEAQVDVADERHYAFYLLSIRSGTFSLAYLR